MGARKTPLEQMRELADQGMEPWQIAAALGVREATVAIALRTPTGGGAAGVVERITGQSPVAAAVADVERDRQAAAAVAPPTFQAASPPVEEPATAVIVCTVDETVGALDDDEQAPAFVPCGDPSNCAAGGDCKDYADELASPTPAAVELDPDDASTYPCASGGDCGCSGTGLLGCPGRDEDAVADARRAREDVLVEETAAEEEEEPVEEQHDHEKACDRCGAEAGTCCPHCSASPGERLRQIREVITERADAIAERLTATLAPPGTEFRFGTEAIPVVVDTALPDDVVVLVAEHVHEPFPVADERGIFHAECECGARWDRAACDVCSLPVAALHIAKTGTARHAHHDLPAPRKD